MNLQISVSQITDLIKKNELDSAEIEAKKICSKFSDIDIAHNLLGIVLQKKNKFEEAIKRFEKAIKINPNFISALNNLGIVYQILKQEKKALIYFNKILEINPNLIEIRNNVAMLYLKENDINNAIDNVKKIIKDNDKYAKAHFTYGKIFEKINQKNNAIKSYHAAIKIDANFSQAYFSLGEVYAKEKKYKNAEINFKKSKEPKAKVRELECLFILNKLSEFEKKVSEQIHNSPNDRRVASITSFIYNKLKKKNIYPFCPNPLEFIYTSSLDRHSFLNKFFLKNLTNEIKKEKFKWEPFGKTTINGYGTVGNLSEKTLPNLSKFEKIINLELKNFYYEYKNKDCNFIKEWPKEYFIDSWSNILTREGHNVSHIHPSGWISGVFYLKIPKNLINNQGGIEFSLHGDDFLSSKIENSQKKSIIPKEGDMVFFPSSLYHKTIPFNSAEERMCIAFDIHKIS